MTEATKGQINRKNIQTAIINSLKKYCPDTADRIADFIAFEFHLSPYTVRYTYIQCLLPSVFSNTTMKESCI
jgi:hypothetical protein